MPTKTQQHVFGRLLRAMMGRGIPAQTAALAISDFCMDCKHIRVTVPDPEPPAHKIILRSAQKV